MLSIEHLGVRYGRRWALRDLSATADGGRVICVLGPNGSGKTTLLRAMAGLLGPARGGIRLDGSRVDRLPPRVRAARICWVPRESSVAGAFTLRDIVTYGRHALGPAPDRVDAALAAVELLDRCDERWHAASSGMQQRTSLARALAQRGAGGLMLLDEPTSALDLRHVAATVSILRACAAEGDTVVASLHDLGLAAELADEIWVLDEGRLVVAGARDAVLSPAALGQIFGVELDWADDGSGGRHLVRASRGGDGGPILGT